jgi:two-component system sensor histidine kinase RegB
MAPDFAAIRVDGTLEQALLNLLNNAARVSPSGIELEAQVRGCQAVLRVLDHGPGPAADVLARAGKAFLPDASADGMGIGLYLANATVERLGGSVRLIQLPSGGCTEVTLPLAESAENA